jgi:hypothetical protein
MLDQDRALHMVCRKGDRISEEALLIEQSVEQEAHHKEDHLHKTHNISSVETGMGALPLGSLL